MTKTILITGSTDGIGFATAKRLVADGHRVLLHGRNEAKLRDKATEIVGSADSPAVERYAGDLSNLDEVEALAEAVTGRHDRLDVLINNAGVFKASGETDAGLDPRFLVNAIAPYLLTRRLLPLLGAGSRVITLSSAAQASVDIDALTGGGGRLGDEAAYAQSKLALTMWSMQLADDLGTDGPVVIAVNPGSLLDTKMVKEAYGRSRGGVEVGARILVSAALDEHFANASGRYFDNDSGDFSDPHADALDAGKRERVVAAIEATLEGRL